MGRAQVAATSLPVCLRFEGAAVPVEESWQDGDGNMANSPNFQRQMSSLLPSFAITCGYSLPLHNRNSRFIQYTFMLSLEVVDPGGGLSMLLLPRLKWQDASGESPGRRQPDDGNASSSAADGWRRQRGSGGLSTALDSKFCICMFARICFLY
jgi:hypothetical protein